MSRRERRQPGFGQRLVVAALQQHALTTARRPALATQLEQGVWARFCGARDCGDAEIDDLAMRAPRGGEDIRHRPEYVDVSGLDRSGYGSRVPAACSTQYFGPRP